MVSVTQKYVSIGMLERLQALWGGSLSQHSEGTARWQVRHRIALRVVEDLLRLPEFQGPKRIAAKEIAAYYTETTSGRRTHGREQRGAKEAPSGQVQGR
jgi:hypothetical protein